MHIPRHRRQVKQPLPLQNRRNLRPARQYPEPPESLIFKTINHQPPARIPQMQISHIYPAFIGMSERGYRALQHRHRLNHPGLRRRQIRPPVRKPVKPARHNGIQLLPLATIGQPVLRIVVRPVNRAVRRNGNPVNVAKSGRPYLHLRLPVFQRRTKSRNRSRQIGPPPAGRHFLLHLRQKPAARIRVMPRMPDAHINPLPVIHQPVGAMIPPQSQDPPHHLPRLVQPAIRPDAV